MKLFLVTVLNLFMLFCYAQASQGSIVAQHGRLQVSGAYVANQHNQKISLAGNSLFWSVDDGNGGEFYTAETLNHLADEWNTSIVRTAMGVMEDWGFGPQGYLVDSLKEISKVNAVVNAAIDKGLYVIIDWHSHKAEDYQQEAIDFFTKMAELYGTYDNVIYEIYNEPINTSWADIKEYAEAVIYAIRSKDPDNLIVVGTKKYSQNVLEASQNPIDDVNVAYTLHFYAGERDHDRLREGDQGEDGEALQAMNNGIALFVTEWGTVPANGGVGVNSVQTQLWMDFLKENYISHANWSVSDKPGEGHPIIQANAGFSGLVNNELTTSGNLVKNIIKNWDVPPVDLSPLGPKLEAELAVLTGVNIADNGSASGGQYVTGFQESGNKVVFNNVTVPSTGTYSLNIAYASSSFKENFIQINNGTKNSFAFPTTNSQFTVISYDVELNQGNNTIAIEKNWGWFDLDYISIGVVDDNPPEPEGTLTFEAEDAQLTGVNITDGENASNGQYISGFTNEGDKIIFNNINAPVAGIYSLTIRYACTSDKQNYVKVNNGTREDVFFSTSIAFTDKTINVNLNQGNNTISIEKNWGWFDVDYIKIDGLNDNPPEPEPGETLRIEAEDGVFTGVNLEDETSASNGQYVAGFDNNGDKVVVSTTIENAGWYQLKIGYRSKSGDKTNDIFLNDTFLQNVVFPQSTAFTEINTGDFYFEAGQSTIGFVKNWGWMDVDYFSLVPAENQNSTSNNICIRTLEISYNATSTSYTGGTIISDATISQNSTIKFIGIEQINLENEFTVEKGASFLATIENCTD